MPTRALWAHWFARLCWRCWPEHTAKKRSAVQPGEKSALGMPGMVGYANDALVAWAHSKCAWLRVVQRADQSALGMPGVVGHAVLALVAWAHSLCAWREKKNACND